MIYLGYVSSHETSQPHLIESRTTQRKVELHLLCTLIELKFNDDGHLAVSKSFILTEIGGSMD